MLPDIENYVRGRYKKGILQDMAKSGSLNLDAIKKLPINRFCNIFYWDSSRKPEIGDIIIFRDSGNYQLFTESAGLDSQH